MSVENPNAFPRPVGPGFPGMTLRDWFAGQALAGLCACNIEVQRAIGELAQEQGVTSNVILAGLAYERADAMLAERAKGGEA